MAGRCQRARKSENNGWGLRILTLTKSDDYGILKNSTTYNLISITSSVKSKLFGKADDFGILKKFSSERVDALVQRCLKVQKLGVPVHSKGWAESAPTLV